MQWNSFMKKLADCAIISFLKQLTDCVMEFFIQTTDWLRDGIPFVSSRLPVWCICLLKKRLTMRWNSFSKRTKCQCDWRLLLSQPRHLVVFVSENWAQSFVQDPSIQQIWGSRFLAEFCEKLVSILLDLSCCSFFLPFSAKICPNFYVNKAVNTTIFRWNWRKSSFELQLFRVLGKLAKV